MAENIINEEIHLVDLLYPSETKRRDCLDRGLAIAKLPQDYALPFDLPRKFAECFENFHTADR